MKTFIYFIISICVSIQAFAQTDRVDNALLLDYYQNQRFADAADYLKSIYPEPINDLKALSRLAYTSLMAGKLTDAEGFYQRVYNADSTNTAVLYNMASINQRRGNANKAELYYKRIIFRDTTDFQVYKQLAAITHNKGNISGEIVYLQKANTLKPLDFDVASDLSDLYVNLKQFSQAEKVLTLAIAADPENIVLMHSLLKLTYEQEKWKQVIKTGEQLIALDDNSQRIKLGIAYYRVKNYICGLETLMAITDDKQTETSYYFIAACYKQLKDQKTAIVYFKNAIKLSLSDATSAYYNEMADSYETLNEFKKAQEAYQKGLLYDEKPLTFYFLAILFDTKLNDKKNALKYYKKYIADKPDKNQQAYFDYSKNRIIALNH